ncbi:MAG: SET domain-containing protein [Spirochaetia bacterium]|nr:SET domain-containing protein [Spirochaetia bacterium]
MIHPDTRLDFLGDSMGHGVVAKQFIPAGTIVYAKDKLEIEMDSAHPLFYDRGYREIIDKYSYIEPSGMYVISWDLAKYVNHSCSSNTLSTGYGFEIAVRDILPGEEITDDYGMLNIEHELSCSCGSDNCRGYVKPNDLEFLSEEWDERVKNALKNFNEVHQPLKHLVTIETLLELESFFLRKENYKSVSSLLLKRTNIFHTAEY